MVELLCALFLLFFFDQASAAASRAVDLHGCCVGGDAGTRQTELHTEREPLQWSVVWAQKGMYARTHARTRGQMATTASSSVASSVQKNLLSGDMVLALFAQVALIVFDRLVYVYRSLRWKLLVQYSCVAFAAPVQCPEPQSWCAVVQVGCVLAGADLRHLAAQRAAAVSG